MHVAEPVLMRRPRHLLAAIGTFVVVVAAAAGIYWATSGDSGSEKAATTTAGCSRLDATPEP